MLIDLYLLLAQKNYHIWYLDSQILSQDMMGKQLINQQN